MVAKRTVIASRQNPSYKKWKRYASHPHRKDCPWVMVEGWKQVEDVARMRPIELLLFSRSGARSVDKLLLRAKEAVCLKDELLDGVSQVSSPQIVAFFRKPGWSIEDLTDHVLYLDGLQDPGNLGTLIRSAAATGLFSVVNGPRTVSCYNTKVVRATAGLLFKVPIVSGVTLTELEKRGYKIWKASAGKGCSYLKAILKAPLVLVVGSEGGGIRHSGEQFSSTDLHVPMQTGIDSLNAAVAGSLLMYEVFRQGEIA